MSDTLKAPCAPSAPYGQFDEKGYHFEARWPAGSHEARAFVLTVAREGVELLTLTVPMLYAPTFGADAGDVASLEAATEQLVAMLPPEGLTESHYLALAEQLGARRVTPVH